MTPFFEALLLQAGYNAALVGIGAGLLGFAAGAAGTFLFLRKRALVSDALVTVIDGPTAPFAAGQSLTQKLDLPVRLILALVAGVGLVFLLHYLDTSVRDATELEDLQVSVLAEIPKH